VIARPDSAALFQSDGRVLREPADVVPLPVAPPRAIADRLQHRARGEWWTLLAELDVRLLVSREYEHLLLCIGLDARGRPDISYLPLPHPSGVAVDPVGGDVWVALTRNPNQLLALRPQRIDHLGVEHRMLLPSRSLFFPGSYYLHDLAFVNGHLYANAVGKNHVAEVKTDGSMRACWWPRVMDKDGAPDTRRNWLQLNSIAAGASLAESFFTASTSRRLRYPPGHRRFDADREGVVFSGLTRDVVATGLTRPHSARLQGQTVWVDNSGYGEVGVISDARLEIVQRLPGWTRGLCIVQGVAFVGTSRVLPAYAHYAPGVRDAVCGIHALDAGSGRVLGSIEWPMGNQLFSIESVSAQQFTGLPYNRRRPQGTPAVAQAFYVQPTAN
jgi:uncharacterized protein (TIGR03032 family)